ncbi:MAG: hypothetical protein WC783_00875 [Candidatus Paceibacterota bacterium]|jgi:chromosome segregation ATPase
MNNQEKYAGLKKEYDSLKDTLTRFTIKYEEESKKVQKILEDLKKEGIAFNSMDEILAYKKDLELKINNEVENFNKSLKEAKENISNFNAIVEKGE